MATFAIGDVQGCHKSLLALLERLPYHAGRDRLILLGDLVNRGPDSLEVLRWARAQHERVEVVLGNHDLHLLAAAAGRRETRRSDTLAGILGAPDREDLLAWLRSRPFLLRHDPYVFVHAGLHPAWTLERAEQLAADLSGELRERPGSFFDLIGATEPPAWSPALDPEDQLRVALAAFTRMRTLKEDGRFCLDHAGPPQEAPQGCVPWYELPSPRPPQTQVVFGHWAALGACALAGARCLDSGCVWGGALTAVRLEDGEAFVQPSVETGGA